MEEFMCREHNELVSEVDLKNNNHLCLFLGYFRHTNVDQTKT